jgi:hypothetical protein
MPQTVKRRVRQLSGRGWLTRGRKRLGDADYEIDVWQEFSIDMPPAAGEAPPLRPTPPQELVIHVRAEIRTVPDVVRLQTEISTVTLHLQDGRTIDGSFDGARLWPSSDFPHIDV